MPEKINIPIYKCPYCGDIYMKGYFIELHLSRCRFRSNPSKEPREWTIEIITTPQGIETKIIPGKAFHTYY